MKSLGTQEIYSATRSTVVIANNKHKKTHAHRTKFWVKNRPQETNLDRGFTFRTYAKIKLNESYNGRSRGSLGREPQQPRSLKPKKHEVGRPNVPFVQPNLGYGLFFA